MRFGYTFINHFVELKVTQVELFSFFIFKSALYGIIQKLMHKLFTNGLCVCFKLFCLNDSRGATVMLFFIICFGSDSGGVDLCSKLADVRCRSSLSP